MNKRDFIQQATLQFMPQCDLNPDKAISWAERLWDRLSDRGYGAPRAHQPRAHTNYYAQLSADQQPLFDRFWQAFNHKAGRNEAAMSWMKIAPDQAMAEQIISAAEAEAMRALPQGQSRKMAQGWLNERRWEDHIRPPSQADAARQTEHELQRLRTEMAGLQQLYDAAPNEALASQISQLQDQIDVIRGDC